MNEMESVRVRCHSVHLRESSESMLRVFDGGESSIDEEDTSSEKDEGEDVWIDVVEY